MNIDTIPQSYHRSPSPILKLPPPFRQSPSPPPLHHVSSSSSSQSPNFHDSPHTVPIPWRLLCPILLICVADAMTYSVLFPFVTDMITSFHVPSDKIGLYSGLGEGIMMLVEAANATNWARLGNKYGRRPCIILGFTVTVLAMPMLAFSGSVWQLVIARGISQYFDVEKDESRR